MNIFFIASVFFLPPAEAQVQAAVVTAVSGEVNILSEPAKAGGDKPRVKFEGKVYALTKPRIGSHLQVKDVVQTGTNGRLKGVYDNGDQLIVGSGTAFVVPYTKSGASEKKGATVELLYGKVRAMISKNGPHANMEVKTPSAVAGVRGTDFFVSHFGPTGTAVTVLRGEVAVAQSESKLASSGGTVSTVKSGQTATVKPAAETAKAQTAGQASKASAGDAKDEAKPVITVETASKERLMDVQVSSNVKPTEEEIHELSEKQQKEVKTLETKSNEAVLNEIKTYDPKLYDTLKQSPHRDAGDINTAVVSQLYKQAPTEQPKAKPSRKDIDALGSDVYEKYFKSE